MRGRHLRRLDAIEAVREPGFPGEWHRWRTTGLLPANRRTSWLILQFEQFMAAGHACTWGVDLATMSVAEELPGWTDVGRAELEAEVARRVQRLGLCKRAVAGDQAAQVEFGRVTAGGGGR